jgi:hypothetical protein
MEHECRHRINLDDLLDNWVSDQEGVIGLEVIAVYDMKGERISGGSELEVVYELTIDDGVDKSEPTPEEENEWLKGGGF